VTVCGLRAGKYLNSIESAYSLGDRNRFSKIQYLSLAILSSYSDVQFGILRYGVLRSFERARLRENGN